MGQNTEELSTTPADIAATRHSLSRDIDELTDKVSPARVVDRRKEAAKSRLSSVRRKVMGSAGASGGGSVSGAASSVSDAASGAVGAVGARAQGNPLAAGLVAFGAGMLISALVPASEKEAQAARRAVDAAREHGQPVVEQAKSVGAQLGQDLKESAAESADQLTSSTRDSLKTVTDEGRTSAETVKDEARPNP